MQKIDVKARYKLPDKVQYCKRCVISNMRPRIVFDEKGICNACRFAEHKRTKVNWDEREAELRDLLDRHRSKDGGFDCVVPSSGGKDSSYVAHQLKYEYGMHPLTVTWSPLSYTDIGWQNFQALNAAGLDNIMGTPNGRTVRRLCKAAMIEMGDPFQPFIYGQILFPLNIALKYGIKLIFSGENAEAEYGGSPEAWDSKGHGVEDYDKYWFSNFPVEYWLERGFTRADLTSYLGPTQDQVTAAGVQRYFYGYFKNWVHQRNFYYAAEHCGFRPNTVRTEGTYTKYSSIDDRLDGFHHYFALLKFGIGRCTANAAREVRDGNITREEAVALIRRYDAEFPRKYFPDLLEFCGITEEDFWEIAEIWRNEHVWKRRGNEWILKQQVE